MKTDDFEKRLQQTAPREIPAAWREEILNVARRAETSRHPSPGSRPGLLATLIQQLAATFRPHRAAWTGLAAAWLVILAMNLTAQDSSTFTATSSSIPSAETMQALKQQRLLFAELVEHSAPRLTPTIPVAPPGPRSQRREEITTV